MTDRRNEWNPICCLDLCLGRTEQVKSENSDQSYPGLTVYKVSVDRNAQEAIRYVGFEYRWVWTQIVGAIRGNEITQQTREG